MTALRRGLTALAALVGIAAATPAVAQADYGDWQVQYNITYDRAKARCGEGGSVYCKNPTYGDIGCYGSTAGQSPCYAGSGIYGDHSRWFLWKYQQNSWIPGYLILEECWHYMRINHGYAYEIFYEDRRCERQ